MATRHLKRLQQQLESKQQASDVQEDASDDESSASPEAKAAPFNPFDLLSDDEDAAAAPGSAHGSDAGSDAEQPQQQQPAKQQTAQKAPSKASSKKKGKGSKKGAGGGAEGRQQGEETEEAAGISQVNVGEKEEDIDAILKELNIQQAPASTSNGTHKAPSTSGPPLLGIDARNLRGDSELRRIFGGDVVASVDRSDAAGAGGGGPGGLGGRRGNMPRGVAAAVRRRLKKGWLVTPKEHWPVCDGGLSMEVAGTSKDGRPVFHYVQSSAYRSTQLAFEQCQATYDPNNIAALLQRAPYHVDALLAMYDLYRHMGEGQYAEEVLDRALYALESAWPPSFDVGAGICRVDFEVPENRALFTALFRRMQALSRQGCHISALEVCKLLLALDPEDPLGCLCSIDYLALRAAKYDYLLRFVDEFETGASLALLPNFAYNRALARLFQQQQEQQPAASAAASSSSGSTSSRPSKQQPNSKGASGSASTAAGGDEGPSSSGRGDGSGSGLPSGEELLLQAVLLHPAVVVQLMTRLQEKGVGKDAAWASLLKRKLFVQASHGGSASLEHLTSLFVERSHELWRVPDAQAWLQQAAGRAADIGDGQTAAATAAGGLNAKDWACVRQESFAKGEDNEYRHLRLHDFSDQVNALPREEVQAAMAAGGIAGIEDELEQQLAQLQMAMAQAQQRQGANVSEEELQNMNPIMALLRSMLPWVNAGEQPDYAAAEDGRGDGPAGDGGQGGGAGAAGQQQGQQ